MAMENKRIIQLSTERTNLTSDDYVMVDSDADGSAKYRLDRLKETDTTLSVSGMAADAAATGQAISEEAQARTQAVTAETQARQQAITAESQARQAADTALGNDVQDLKSAITINGLDFLDYFNPTWERKNVGIGGTDKIGTTTYCWEGSTTRISFRPYVNIYHAKSIVCKVTSGYKYIVVGFNEDVSARVYYSDWTTTENPHDLTGVGNVIVILSKTDDSTITLDDADKIQIEINIYPSALYNLIEQTEDIKDDIADLQNDVTMSARLFNEQSLWSRYVVGTGGSNKIGTTNKSFDSSTTRISLYPLVDVHNIASLTVKPDAGYKFYMFGFNQEVSSVTRDTGWQTSEQTYDISSDYYITICFADTSNGTINVDSCSKLTVTINEKIKDVVAEQKEEIEEINNKIKVELPSYWVDYFDTKQAELTAADMALGFSGVSFAFVTDVHINTNNKLSPVVIKYILSHTDINTAICGGDIITDYNTKANAIKELQWWSENTKNLHMINLHGNHDGNSNNQTDQTQIISDAEFYGLMCRQSEEIVNWENGTLYGYKDNEDQKVRFIFLDTGAPDSAVINDAQIAWMQSKITELESAWTVIVFAHQFWTGTNKATPTLTIDACGTKIMNGLDAIYDTIDATIACVIAGHCHRDYSMTSVKGYPIIATTCDASGTNASTYDPDQPTRTAGTTTEQCFDLYYVNTSDKTIKTIRIGAGDTTQDRSFSY